ncbi:MAG: endolytic transglycosylase MltG [Candidatus Kaiserbacteria bacterium]|nr:endolytic transglycosylase MltG [Candidatus Kaiserbacteria bacterium]
MASLETFIERVLAAYERVLEALAWRTREHANRRTIFIIITLGALAIYLYLNVIRPPDNFPLNELVTVQDGASLSDISLRLEKDSVVRSALSFKVAVTLTGNQHNMHAGDYLFKEPRDLLSVARAVAVGAFGLEPMKIRIPEGATTKEMAILFGGRLLRFDKSKFLETAVPLEGFLFPDTYFFLPNATEDLVVRTMKQNFDTQISTIQDKIDAFGKPLRDVVIMASLLEREARKVEDRKMIAGVLWNRIKIGMLLQVDAAFLYTIGKGSYQLTTKDLTSDSPYNTYRNKGLPPGPIGSPSMSSLIAAVTPTPNKNLYYLADRSGVTYYSATYAEHLRKKRIYIY